MIKVNLKLIYIAFFAFATFTTQSSLAYPSGYSDKRNSEENQGSTRSLYSPYRHTKIHRVDSRKHKEYNSSPTQTVPKFPIEAIGGQEGKASDSDMSIIKDYYRHLNVNNKVALKRYVAINFLYAPRTTVNGAKDKLVGGTDFRNAAIDAFIQKYATSTSLTLSRLNVGGSLVYGWISGPHSRREIEVLFLQSSYANTTTTTSVPSTTTTTAAALSFTTSINGISTTYSYSNVEYIQRNISVHYNFYYELGDVLSKDVKFRPFIMLGIGATTRVNFLRLSNGTLGVGGGITDITTSQRYFQNIRPSLNIGVGLAYKTSESFDFTFKAQSIQPYEDLNFGNYMLSMGIRFLF
jgi:hypothetical protein